MTADGHTGDLAASYVLDACSPDEGETVAEHASHCPECATEIASLRRVTERIAMSTARVPPPGLRSRVLSAALAARPAENEARQLVDQYRLQVDELDRLLNGLSSSQWQLPSGRHDSLRDLVAHLNGNDERVASAAGIGPPRTDPAVRSRWRRQADAIIEAVNRPDPGLLDREVPLAGRAAIRRPLREALVQRHFETWIHAEDVRGVLDLPPRGPSPRQVTDIVGFALRLLPAAMEAAGRAHQAAAIRLVLTGEGGTDRLVDLAPTAGAVVAEVSMPAERFCRLLAGRIPVASVDAGIDGDLTAANDFLAVAATMGCE